MGLILLLRALLIGAVVFFGFRFFRGLLASGTGSRPGQPPGPDPRWQKRSSDDSSWRQQTSSRSKSPYEVLGVPTHATQQEIRAAYQELVQQYHPDRVADLGVELRELAERRTKEINAAYAQLRRR